MTHEIPDKPRYTFQVLSIMSRCYRALGNYSDEEVVAVLQNTASNQAPPGDSTLAQQAKESLIRIEMKKQGIVETVDQINYLTSKLSGPGDGEKNTYVLPGVKSKEALQNGAIQALLAGMGENALPYLEMKLKEAKDAGQAKALKQSIEKIETISENQKRRKHANGVLK